MPYRWVRLAQDESRSFDVLAIRDISDARVLDSVCRALRVGVGDIVTVAEDKPFQAEDDNP